VQLHRLSLALSIHPSSLPCCWSASRC